MDKFRDLRNIELHHVDTEIVVEGIAQVVPSQSGSQVNTKRQPYKMYGNV